MLLMASTDRLFSCLFNNLEENKEVYQHPRSQRWFLADFASLKTKNLKDLIHSPTVNVNIALLEDKKEFGKLVKPIQFTE